MADKIVVLRDGRIEQVGAPLELYDRPANTFVACFIGSPAMNLLPGVFRGHTCVMGNRTTLPVCPSIALSEGARLTIGVRPEHIEVIADDGDSDTEDGIPAKLIALEPTGAETVIMADVAGTNVTVVTKERIALLPGDRVRLKPLTSKQLYFDADGQRLTA